MKTRLNVRQIFVADYLKEALLSRMDRFDKFFSSETPAELTLSQKRGNKVLEVTIFANSTLFRAEVTAESFQNAMDEAIDIIERQIRRHKTKLQKQIKNGTLSDLIALPEASEPTVQEEDSPYEIRVKSFALKPMTVDEAILQMELLGHSFYLFRNAQDENVCVVYEKKDGSYGLLIPTE